MLKDDFKNLVMVEYWNKLRDAVKEFGTQTEGFYKRRDEIDDWEKNEHYLLYIKYRVEPPYSLKAWVKAFEVGTPEAMTDYCNMMREI